MELKDWEISREDGKVWQPVKVPGCWEEAGFPKNDAGPFWYRTRVYIPEEIAGRRTWLRFGAVSYACRVFVNGNKVGEHRGMWDAFEVEITHWISAGKPAEIKVEVEKPASLINGPDSPSMPGRYPTRKTLSGFPPYVWGHSCGGIWQAVELIFTGATRIREICARGDSEGKIRVEVETEGEGWLRVEIIDPHGEKVWVGEGETEGGNGSFEGRLPEPEAWSLENPVLYEVRASLYHKDAKNGKNGIRRNTPDSRRWEGGEGEADHQVVKFGLKTVTVQGSQIRLNGRPIYPRLILSWGWYADRLRPEPGQERVRADLLRLRDLGYNGVKLCLWVPPEYYFELADELGMLVWLELPMWIPLPDADFRSQTLVEYRRLVRQARQHPSVVIYTLGCELNWQVDSAFLEALYTGVRQLVPEGQALLRDNSGSGEAYGGLLQEFADFYDNHFYCDLQFLGPTLDAFTPGWRETRPWLMGEFGDYDTLRNFPALLRGGKSEAPGGVTSDAGSSGSNPSWWMDTDDDVNPVGARWEMRVNKSMERLKQVGLWPRVEELRLASYRQGLLHRKVTLETVRARPDLSGYVVTGEVDTPVSTPGMWDDLGQDKFAPEAFRAFNQDAVLLLGWDRRRTWQTGGDRPLMWDRYNYPAGSIYRAHLILSNYSSQVGAMEVEWDAHQAGEGIETQPIAHSHYITNCAILQGILQEVCVIEFQLPEINHPRRIDLRVRARMGDILSENTWSLWIYPTGFWERVAPFTFMDPQGWLEDLPALLTDQRMPELDKGVVLVSTGWTPETVELLAKGGKVLLLQGASSPPGLLTTVRLPFWREALKFVEPHPAWGDYPHEQNPGMQFYGLATDCALAGEGEVRWGEMGIQPARRNRRAAHRQYSASLSNRHWLRQPLLRRLDMRGMELHDYVVEYTNHQGGKLIVSTLRFQGGLGDQPSGLRNNLAAQYLLAQWINYLARSN